MFSRSYFSPSYFARSYYAGPAGFVDGAVLLTTNASFDISGQRVKSSDVQIPALSTALTLGLKVSQANADILANSATQLNAVFSASSGALINAANVTNLNAQRLRLGQIAVFPSLTSRFTGHVMFSFGLSIELASLTAIQNQKLHVSGFLISGLSATAQLAERVRHSTIPAQMVSAFVSSAVPVRQPNVLIFPQSVTSAAANTRLVGNSSAAPLSGVQVQGNLTAVAFLSVSGGAVPHITASILYEDTANSAAIYSDTADRAANYTSAVSAGNVYSDTLDDSANYQDQTDNTNS